MTKVTKLATAFVALSFSSIAFSTTPQEVKTSVVEMCAAFQSLSNISLERMSTDPENVYRLLATLAKTDSGWYDSVLLDMMNELSSTNLNPIEFGNRWFDQCKTQGFEHVDEIVSKYQ